MTDFSGLFESGSQAQAMQHVSEIELAARLSELTVLVDNGQRDREHMERLSKIRKEREEEERRLLALRNPGPNLQGLQPPQLPQGNAQNWRPAPNWNRIMPQLTPEQWRMLRRVIPNVLPRLLP
jgi:hypothetical protein